MNAQSGALRIFLYNWPVYLATFCLAALALLAPLPPQLPVMTVRLLLGAAPLVWSVGSLLVSAYVYDWSGLVEGRWLPPLLPSRLASWATIHAGLDTEVDLDAVMPGACVARLDVFDATVMTAPSISRARRRTAMAHQASACSPTALALPDASCDAVVVAFTAHELREPAVREQFFAELQRSLRPGGRVVVLEHLRDFANLLAFGPGFFHFLPRAEWLRLARHSNLAVASERRVTPWVMALTLERTS